MKQMELDEVMKFAKQKGFDKVKYVGEYKGKRVYKPLHKKMLYTGFPAFILVSDGMMEYINTRLGLEILGELLKNNS